MGMRKVRDLASNEAGWDAEEKFDDKGEDDADEVNGKGENGEDKFEETHGLRSFLVVSEAALGSCIFLPAMEGIIT